LMLIPAVIFFFVRYKVLAAQGPFKETFSSLDNLIVGAQNPAERFASAFMMCGRYLYALLIPHPLVSDLGFPQYKPVGFGDWRALAGFAAMAGMSIWALMRLRKKHFLSFAVLFFLVTFSIASNIVMVIGTSYGERLLYAPSLGFAFALAFLVVKILKINDLESVWNPNGKGALLWGFAGIVVVAYSFFTIQRNPAWYDSGALYEADIVHSPNCAKLNYHRGLDMVQKGLDEKTGERKDSTWILKGIESYTKAMSLYPGYHDAFGSRGVAHLKLGHYAQAEADFFKALEYRPNDAKTYSNLGFIYMLQQKPEQAQEVYQKALQYDPRYVDARRNLGAVLAMQKKFPEAIQQWTEGLKYEPNNYTLLFYIGSAYKDMGRPDQAQPWFERAKAAENVKERR
jgi:protein O-mannosyl-transferase